MRCYVLRVTFTGAYQRNYRPHRIYTIKITLANNLCWNLKIFVKWDYGLLTPNWFKQNLMHFVVISSNGQQKIKSVGTWRKISWSPYGHIGIERAIVGFGDKFLLGRFTDIAKTVIYFLQRCEALVLYFWTKSIIWNGH